MMGGDNLARRPQWRDWREIGRLMPSGVIARPGYNDRAHARRAMGWLRRFVRPADQKKHWTDWRPPALVFLRFSPDVRSATAIRQANPRWFERYEGRALRDPLTRSEEHTSELQSLMRISYAVFCLITKNTQTTLPY